MVDNGAKSVLDVTRQTTTISGLTFTVNDDKTITVSGTAGASNVAFNLYTGTNYIQNEYSGMILSDGSPESTQNVYLYYAVSNNGSSAAVEYSLYGNTSKEIGTFPYVRFAILVKANTSITNPITIKPMICTKAAWDVSHAYEPYAKTNPELTVENASQQSEIDYAVNTGVKNLFDINATPITYHTTYTLTGGVLSGTSNGDWASYNVPVNLPAGDYIFSAVISNFSRDSGAGEGTIRIRITNAVSGGTTIGTTNITGNGAISIPFSWGGGQFYTQYSFNFSSTGSYVNSFTVSSNMIRPAAITDQTYEPYALSNPTLTPAVIKAVDEGAKNLLKIEAIGADSTTYGTTVTKNGVEYALQADGSIVINRVSSNANSSYIFFRKKDGSTAYITDYMDNEHYLSGITGGSVGTYALFISNYNSQGTSRYVGDPVLLTSSSIAPNACGISIASGYSPVNLVFKPMICTAADWAISQKFVPYALPNPTLTPAVIKAVDEGAKNLLQLFQLGSSNANVGNPCTSQGVEYEIQSDGTITAYRKSSASAGAYIFLYKNGAVQNLSEFFDGNHIWSGNPPQYPDGGVSVWYKIGSGSNITLPNGALLPNANGEAVQIGFQIQTALSPTQSNPIVFKPMICTAEAWAVSQKFVPYALSNPVITQEVNWNVNQGVKNLIKLNPDTYTSGNVVVKLNDDGTVSVSLSSGSTANTTFSRAIKTITDLRDMDLILNGCPSGGNYSSGYALYISDDSTTKEKDEGNGVLVPKNTAVTTSYLALIVRSGTAISGTLTFKPMIRPASITDSTFQPYALPNPTLTADITSLKHIVDPRSQSQVSGGNLDNITVSEIRVYIAPSGLPTGVSASSVCIVETLVVDSNSAYQVITLLSNQGTAQDRSYPTYKRVKVGGVWYDWKLIIS